MAGTQRRPRAVAASLSLTQRSSLRRSAGRPRAMSRRQLPVAVTGRTPFIKAAALSADSPMGAPPGRKSRRTAWSRLRTRVRSWTRSSRRSVSSRRIVAWSSRTTGRSHGGRGRHPGDVEGVPDIGPAVSAGGRQPDPGRQGGGHIDHVLARGGQLLGERTPQAAGTLDRETTAGPLLTPAHQPADDSGVDYEPALSHLVAGAVVVRDGLTIARSAWTRSAVPGPVRFARQS